MRSIVVKTINILAKKILAKYNPAVIGITGSAGKSSARKAIYEILKRKYNIVCNKSEYKTDLNIPLAVIGAEVKSRSVGQWARVISKGSQMIFEKKKYPDVLVLEMDVNRPRDMKKMLEIVRPNIGILTGIGQFPSHTQYFKSAKHVAREKALLIKSLGKKGLAILNYDDDFSRDAAKGTKAEVLTYGFRPDADIKAEEIFLGDRKWRINDGSFGMSFKISHKGTTVPFRLPYALGRGQIYATLAAAAVGIRLGFNLLEISEILSGYQPLPGRMKLIRGINGSLIIDDTFNANPGSTLTALETLGKLDSVRKIAVLGDMLELGEYSESGHEEVGRKVPSFADLLIAYGSKGKTIYDQAKKSGMKAGKVHHFNDMERLINFLRDAIDSKDVVLVKGSREMHMEKIVRNIMAESKMAEELLVK